VRHRDLVRHTRSTSRSPFLRNVPRQWGRGNANGSAARLCRPRGRPRGARAGLELQRAGAEERGEALQPGSSRCPRLGTLTPCTPLPPRVPPQLPPREPTREGHPRRCWRCSRLHPARTTEPRRQARRHPRRWARVCAVSRCVTAVQSPRGRSLPRKLAKTQRLNASGGLVT